MSRPIKFRAWDKKARKWRVVTTLVWYKPDTGKTGVCGVVIVTDTNHDQFLPIEDVELVECTGLLDKNGREIYEGDIVKFISDRGYLQEPIEQVLVVEHDDQYWSLAFKRVDGELRINEHVMSNEAAEVEVIGNIHEHPHLLNKKGNE